jgi:hypothetical protein
LHSEANRRDEKREKLKRRLEEERMKDCSFKPKIEDSNKIGVSKSFSQNKPIYERVDEIQRNKNEYLSKLKLESELNDENLKFRPFVNKYSEKILNKKSKMHGSTKNLNVIERLTKDASERIEKLYKKKEEIQNEVNAQYTFHPQLSNYSTGSLQNTGLKG